MLIAPNPPQHKPGITVRTNRTFFQYFTSIAAILLLSLNTFAGGFQLNLQGGRAVGMGGAFTAVANDASTVYFNPGGLSQLKAGHHIMLGVHYVMPTVSLQTEVNANINQTTPNANPIHAYYAGRFGEKWTVGMQVNNQFGSTSSFDDGWQGRFIIQNIALRTFMYQPTVGYKVSDKLGVGAGFVYASGDFSTEKAVPLSSVNVDYGKARLSGSGSSWGYNVGVHYQLWEGELAGGTLSAAVGASYRSGMKIELKNGVAEFVNIPNSLRGTFPLTTDFTSELNLPSVGNGGITLNYKTEKLGARLAYDINHTGWSTYDTLTFDFAHEETPDTKLTKAWKDTYTHRIGAEVGYNEFLYLRGGITIDKSPIPDGYVSPELPDADNTSFSLGIGIQYNVLQLDLSYIRQNVQRESSLIDAGFSAKYHRIVNVFGASLRYTITRYAQ